MPVTDPIADMLAVLKNGVVAHKEAVLVKRSNLHEGILAVLKSENFISNYKAIEDKKQGLFKVYLKYTKNGTPCLTDVRRISKPGRRVYTKTKAIKNVYGEIGIALISTSEGIVAHKEAKEKNLGGEILCHIW